MHIERELTIGTNAMPVHRETSKTASAVLMAALGLALVFVAGFAESNILHNAAHDTRHSTGFPCH